MVRFYLLTFFFILSCARGLAADSIHSDTTLETIIQKANELYLKSDFDGGLSLVGQLEQTYPESPAVSYFLADGYWWKIFRAYVYERNEKDSPYDQLFNQYVEQTIERSKKLLEKNKQDVVGLFYLGNAYSLKSRVKGLRGSYFAAGREAAKGKEHLERVLQLEPKEYDAFYNLGVYNYLAGTLPGYAKVLKTLLFLPGGNKEKGMDYLKIASKKSIYFSTEAQLILAHFYSNFEDLPHEALSIVQKFHQKYPDNAWYHYWLGTLYSDEINDYVTAEKVYIEILQRCRRERPGTYTEEIQNQTRLKLARVHSRQLYPERAIDEIKALIADKPAAPSWLLPRAYLELGGVYDQIGMHKEAVTAYTQVLSFRNHRSFHEDAKKLRKQRYDQTTADIYRLTLGARRLASDGRFLEAEASFQNILKRYPKSPQTIYYMGEMYYLKRDYVRAEGVFKDVLSRKPQEPKWLMAGAYVKLGLIYEARKQEQAAKLSYQKALEATYIASDDRNAAKRRLRMISEARR